MEVIFHATTSFYGVHVILKTITRTRTLKGGGFGLTTGNQYNFTAQDHVLDAEKDESISCNSREWIRIGFGGERKRSRSWHN